MKRGHADSSGARYLARFTMLDGTYRYIMPDPDEVDSDASAAAGRLVLREGVDVRAVFRRGAFGSFSVRRQEPYDVPIIREGLFFSYEARLVRRCYGTTIDGVRTSFKFHVVPRAIGYQSVRWGVGMTKLSEHAEIRAKLRAIKAAVPAVASPAPESADLDPLVAAAEIASAPRAAWREWRRFGSREEFLRRLRDEPATTLITMGRLSASTGAKKLKERLRDEWAPTVLRLARRGLDSVRTAPRFQAEQHRDEKRGVSACSPRSRYGRAARELFADLVQEGFLVLFETAARYVPTIDIANRFDKLAFVHIQWAIKKKASTEFGHEASIDDLPPALIAAASLDAGPRDMSIEDEVDYATACASGLAAFSRLFNASSNDGSALLSGSLSEERLALMADRIRRGLSSPKPGPGPSVDVRRAPETDEERLVAAAGLPISDARPLTEAGVLVQRWLSLEASIASGRIRPVAACRLPLEAA